MTRLFALTLWTLAFIAALFTLTTDVWQGVPYSVLYFVGAIVLGVMYPLGTWATAKHYPETDPFAWWSFLIMAWLAVLAALSKLVYIPPSAWEKLVPL